MSKKIYIRQIKDLIQTKYINILKTCGKLNDISYLPYDNKKEISKSLSILSKINSQVFVSYKKTLKIKVEKVAQIYKEFIKSLILKAGNIVSSSIPNNEIWRVV